MYYVSYRLDAHVLSSGLRPSVHVVCDARPTGAKLRGGGGAGVLPLNLPHRLHVRAVLKSVLWSGENCCRCRLSKIDRPSFQKREEPNASVSVPYGCLFCAAVVKNLLEY